MKLYSNEYECCGCEACANACPTKAISMVPNFMGELYPKINEDACIRCGKCTKVCDFKKQNVGHIPMEAYGAKTKDIASYKNATSGGVFSVLANAIIEEGGVVIGAMLEYDINKEELDVYHTIIDNKETIFRLQGSKYIQSRIGSVFADIRSLLKKDVPVLFCGTPCQVAGLKSFLEKDYNKLYTIDIVCHGVPSMIFFNSHIRYIEKTKKIKIKNVKFREKEAEHPGIDIRYLWGNEQAKKHADVWPTLDSYYQLFLDGQTYRDSCYSCKYANEKRQGDLSICDFWGADKEIPRETLKNECINLSDGFSGVLVNTEKGKRLFKKNAEKMDFIPVKPEQIIKWNPQLMAPSVKGIFWEEIRKQYRTGQKKFETWYKKTYAKKIWNYKIKSMLGKIISERVKIKIKTFIAWSK